MLSNLLQDVNVPYVTWNTEKKHLHFSLKKEGKSIPYQRKFRQSSLTEKESSSLTFVSQFVDKEFIKFKGR